MQRFTKILIVGSNSPNNTSIKEILQAHPQFITKCVFTKQTVFKLIAEFLPDIILIELFTKEKNGYEICKTIRKESGNRFPIIVLLSDQAHIEDRLRGYEVGADDFIAKPFVKEELLAKLYVYSRLRRIEELDLFKTTALNLLCHETRTPLNGILLGSELLSENKNIPDSARSYIKMIGSCGNEIHKFIEKVSRYCSFKEGVALNVKKDYIYKSIQYVIDSFGVNKAGMINVSCDESIRFSADWELLREVFFYILDNSLDYCTDSGVVEFICEQSEENVIITITDEGPGIDLANSRNIFEGLYSTDISHHHKGAALSLAIAKEIIELHQGSITCRNGENGGAKFTLSLKKDLDDLLKVG